MPACLRSQNKMDGLKYRIANNFVFSMFAKRQVLKGEKRENRKYSRRACFIGTSYEWRWFCFSASPEDELCYLCVIKKLKIANLLPVLSSSVCTLHTASLDLLTRCGGVRCG